MPSVLFVGGVKDGERRDMEVLPAHYGVAKLRETAGLLEAVDLTTPFDTEDYRLEAIRGTQAIIYVYVLVGLATDQLLDRLIANYRPH